MGQRRPNAAGTGLAPASSNSQSSGPAVEQAISLEIEAETEGEGGENWKWEEGSFFPHAGFWEQMMEKNYSFGNYAD